MNDIERHAALISNEVTLASIQDAQAAYAEALKNYKRDEEFQRRQDFATVRQSLSPRLYDDDLETFRKRRSPDSGKWVEKNDEFSAWFNTSNKSKQVLWIEGIPGAGISGFNRDFRRSIVLSGGRKVLSFGIYRRNRSTPNQ